MAARYTEQQIKNILATVEEKGVKAACAEHGVGDASIYIWKKKYTPGAVAKRARKAATKAAAVVKSPKVEEMRVEAVVTPITAATKAAAVENVVENVYQRMTNTFAPVIPAKDANFVPFGVFKEIKDIISSGEFAPTMVTGETGNGKTKAILMACAALGRACVSVSIDSRTDDETLFGKYSLVNGNTIFEKGPVLVAMETGSILLFDEMDRGNPENMVALNMVLDGYPYLNPKTGEYVVAKPGFNVFCTTNTKCQGDSTDRYVAAKVMDEAFLERFPIMLEQQYPSPTQEVKILSKVCDNAEFVDTLVKWANVTRNTYRSGAISNFVTTRRLTFIASKNLRITRNPLRAVELAVNRFDTELKDALIELFKSISSGNYHGELADTHSADSAE